MANRRKMGLQRMELARLLSRVEGGATPRVKNNADKAEHRASTEGVPWLLAKMYASSPVVNTDQSRIEGVGMVPRLYIPVTPEEKEKTRPASEKLKNWFLKGKWA